MAPTIRTPTVTDAPEVARIYVESWNQGFGELLGRRSLSNTEVARWSTDLLGNRARWWVAQDQEGVAGFVGICPSRDPVDPAVGELDTIAVDPSRWRTGVGRALMRVALEALADEGYQEAVLWTPAGHEGAHVFFEKLGWRATGAERAEGKHVAFRTQLRQRPGRH